MVVTGCDLVGEIGDFRGGLAGVKKIVVAYRRGKSFSYHNLHGYRRGVREIVCSRLRRRKFYGKFGLHAYPAGASFCADKRMQKRFRAAP